MDNNVVIGPNVSTLVYLASSVENNTCAFQVPPPVKETSYISWTSKIREKRNSAAYAEVQPSKETTPVVSLYERFEKIHTGNRSEIGESALSLINNGQGIGISNSTFWCS
jgi:hypothetical protein